jgi:proteasome accessory factor A
VQRVYYELVLANITRFEWELTELHQIALNMWGAIICGFESGDLSEFDSVLDWRIKLQLFNRYQREQGLPLDSAKLAQVDLMYHELSPERGLYNLLVSQGAIGRLIPKDVVATASATAPQTTRAILRGQFITAAQQKNVSTASDWMHLKVNLPVERSVSLPDPFSAQDDRVEHLISQM